MRIAVVGLGFMGATHIRAILGGAAQLAAVVSRNDRKLSGDLSGTSGNLDTGGGQFDFSGVKKYRTLELALADPEIHAVDLCLPTDQHESAAIAALRHGKHVLVEKPMALDQDACGRMIEESRRAGRVLMVAQVLRFFPSYQALSVARAQIGTIRGGSFRRCCAKPGWGDWLADPARSGGGVFDLLIHDVDQALYLFGAPTAISATGYQHLAHGVDIIDAQLYYDGFCIEIAGGWHPGEFPFSMEYKLVGDGGTVAFSSTGGPPMLYRADGGSQKLESPDGPAADGYRDEISYFAACCSAGSKPEKCMPEESAAAVRLTRALSEARQRNGEKIAWT
jgi:predicted dehydrogenase